MKCNYCEKEFDRKRGTRTCYCSALCRRLSTNQIQRKYFKKAYDDGKIVVKNRPVRLIDSIFDKCCEKTINSPVLSSFQFRLYDKKMKTTYFFSVKEKYVKAKQKLEKQYEDSKI